MTILTNQARNTTTVTGVSLSGGAGETWDQDVNTWNENTGTWDRSFGATNQARNTTALTNQSRNS